MLDHVTLNVRDYVTSKRFYEQALQPVGLEPVMVFDDFRTAGFGVPGQPVFWISQREPLGGSTHVAFSALDRATVDGFHAAALAAGGTDNGAPGLRPQYHESYYGAFVLDPDGNNIEVVCHRSAG